MQTLRAESLNDYLSRVRARADAALDACLPAPTARPALLHEAMRYAVFSGGKRLRPALAYGAARAVRGELDQVLAAADPVAVAVELVHAYSLVHDDLPAMDDDRERRGRPTVHVKFGEANAILAGDALLAAAFGRLARADVPAGQVGPLVERLASAAGSEELVGGQADDLVAATGGSATEADIVSIHRRKTAALFRFALYGAGLLAGGDAEVLGRLDAYGLHFGLAFQAADDLLDADRDETSLLRVRSAERVREHVEHSVAAAVDALNSLAGDAAPLRLLAESLVERASSR